MRLAKHLKRRGLEINMTPMIDVVFLLLIFFMTCSQVSEANREVLDLARLHGSEEQSRSGIIANINAEGELTVLGEPATVAEFVAMCAEEVARLPEQDPTALVIVIRADRRGDSRRVNELVSALTKLGVTKVRVAVRSEP